MDRIYFSEIISKKINESFENLSEQWHSNLPINYFFIDDLLPENIALNIRDKFPNENGLMLRKSLRELKYVSSQLNDHDPIVEEITFAFQQQNVVDAVKRITGIAALEPDAELYAGGISMMGPGHFLNPHLDNSHDRERKRYRALNLLYYVSPDWSLDKGANLELWPNGPKSEATTIVSKFNRLAVMITHKGSWHSVSKNMTNETRCCVSNYYFSKDSIEGSDYFHPTSFRGRPEEPVKDLILQADASLRGVVRSIIPSGINKTSHYYKKKD